MLFPKPDHQGIHIRNFFVLFVCLSLMAYIHFQLDQATSTLEETNAIVSSILKNDTYSITQQRILNLKQSLESKSYHQLSQAQCFVRIYLDVLNNENFIDQNQDKNSPQPQQINGKIELTFTELKFPTISHDLQGFKNCSDILTLMNFLNPTKTDFIYTRFMQEKYGYFIKTSQSEQDNKSTTNQTKFCILNNQFNTSTTKLRQSINSIIDQSYQNYRLVILDNGSTDGSYEIAKVILQDLKERLTKEKTENAENIQKKYQIVKEESRLGFWELYKKHEDACEGMEFVVFVDGRDSLPTRHTLNILSRQILTSKVRPDLITAPILKRKQLSRQSSAGLSDLGKMGHVPTLSFKVLSMQILKKMKDRLQQLTKSASHSFEVEQTTVQSLFDWCKSNNKTILEVDQMLYVYDTIQNKQIERNQYYVEIVRNQLRKKRKETKKQNQKAT